MGTRRPIPECPGPQPQRAVVGGALRKRAHADERIFEGVTSRAEGEGSWDPIAHLHAMSKSEHVVPLVRRQGSLVFGEEGIATTDRWQPRQTARRLTHGLL